jgi:hypothetical protein
MCFRNRKDRLNLRMRFVALLLGLLVGGSASIRADEAGDKELMKLMVGAWRSPRHDYVYLADGTWWMGKPQPSGPVPQVTHGKWWIKDHQLCETVQVEGGGAQDNGCETITRLTKHDIVYGGYHMKRIQLTEVDKY